MIRGYAVAHGNECVSDAANDGHSGYTIYSRLIKMAGAMAVPPRESYYSFDVNRGALCDPLGRTWHPINPDYDPGPPPPPRPPKEKKEGQTGGNIEKLPAPVVSRQHRQTQRPWGHRYRQQHNEGFRHEPHRLGEAVPGSSTGQMNRRQRPSGDRTEAGGGWGRGYAGPGPISRPHGGGRGRGGGSRIGTFDKCVRGVLRTLRRL